MDNGNDLIDLTDERVDNLAALLTVSAEQLEDRQRAGAGLARGEHRANELVNLVFGTDVPSVEAWLARSENLEGEPVAA